MPRLRRVTKIPAPLVHLPVCLGLIAYAFALQFATPHLGSIDGYFHIRYSALLREAGWRGFPPRFPWLPLTILSPDRYFDHHFLFHVWLALFAGGDLIIGAKLAAAIGAAVAFIGVYALLVWFRIWRPHWWMLVCLSVAPGFPYRLEMPRVQSWSLACLLTALPLFLRERATSLFVLGWMFTWLYDAFPLLLAIGACAALAQWWLEGTVPWRPLGAAAGGIACGLIVNPYVPDNFRFILHHYGAKLSYGGGAPIGREWYPPLAAQWLGWGGLIALLIAAGTVLYRLRAQLTLEGLTTSLVAMLFLVCYWRSNRFIEYFVPFTIFPVAVLVNPTLPDFVARVSLRWRRNGRIALFVAFGLTTAVAIVQLYGRPHADQYSGAATWLRTHTPSGTLVFLADWDDFPLLYFHDTANTYSMGLDPSYLSERDPSIFDDWRAAVEGRVPHPAAMIRDRFGAVAAFTDHQQVAFIAAMDSDPQARRAFADETGIVYVVPSSEEGHP